MNLINSNMQDHLSGFFKGEAQLWVYILLTILLTIILLLVVWKARNRNNRKLLLRRLKKMGEGIMIDIEVPDGVENIVHLDCLLLTRAGLLVIDIKDYAGLIFGAESIDVWTQVLGSRSYKFDNPLFQNQERVMAVKSLALGVPVSGHVLFTSAGEFPKGKPEGVCTPESLVEDLKYINEYKDLSSSIVDGWEQIKRLLN